MTLVLCPLCKAALAGRRAPDRAIRAASSALDVREEDVRAGIRTRNVALARHIAAFALRRALGRSYPELARDMGFADHTTARAACVRIETLAKSDTRVAELVELVARATTARDQDEVLHAAVG